MTISHKTEVASPPVTRSLPSAPRPKVPSRRERRSAEIRERLFHAALRLFAQRGYSCTTIEDITEAADVGKGTFFNYFPSKEHLLVAFSEIRRNKIRAAIEEARQTGRPMSGILERLYHSLAEEPGKSREMARSMIITMLASEPVWRIVRARMAEGRELTSELMALGQHRGEIRRDRESAELALLFQESFFGSLVLWTLQPSDSLGERLDVSFRQFWSAIEARPPHRSKRKSE